MHNFIYNVKRDVKRKKDQYAQGNTKKFFDRKDLVCAKLKSPAALYFLYIWNETEDCFVPVNWINEVVIIMFSVNKNHETKMKLYWANIFQYFPERINMAL